MRLVDVYAVPWSEITLWQLLGERKPEQSISHRAMPTYEQHVAFVASRPYLGWYLIEHAAVTIGACYLTKEREIGVAIFGAFQAQGLGRQAVARLMQLHPGRFLANINPANEPSLKLFAGKLGFRHIQNTYELA